MGYFHDTANEPMKFCVAFVTLFQKLFSEDMLDGDTFFFFFSTNVSRLFLANAVVNYKRNDLSFLATFGT